MPTIPMLEHPWFESGTDILGIPWVVDAMGATPDTRVEPILEDVCDWEKVVKFPDLKDVDITPIAAMEMKEIDRDKQAAAFMHTCGPFERLEAFMGTTEGIIALVEEPEACSELFEAITDYRIEVAKKIIDAYHPDVYITFDDVATANNTFMSPEAYREVIKPHHKRFVQFLKSQGIIPSQHCCGKCEAILDDFVDNGTMLWHSAQVMNDLEAIQEKYHGKLAIEGFWDTQGTPGQAIATVEDVRAEMRRIVETHGKKGGAIMLPVLTNANGLSLAVGDERLPHVMDEWAKCCRF